MKLVDTRDLKSLGLGCIGSIPIPGTTYFKEEQQMDEVKFVVYDKRCHSSIGVVYASNGDDALKKAKEKFPYEKYPVVYNPDWASAQSRKKGVTP